MTDADLDAEHAAAVAAAPPPCKCGHRREAHGRSNHSVQASGCWSAACGCTAWRPEKEDER